MFYGDTPSTLSYIYDCGSDSLTPLREAISDFLVDREEIDIAFLSHLDSDHVNGIDTLLGKCAVRNVVLPYLDNFALLDAVGNSLEEDAYTASFAEFLERPVTWLRARGVQHVWMAGRAPGNEGPAAPRPDGEARFEAVEPPRIREDARDVRQAVFGIIGRFRGDTLPGGEQVSLLDPGAVLVSSPDGKSIGWWFVPYAPPVDSTKLANFKAALLAIGLNMDTASAKDILQFVRNQRKLFQSCYSTIASNHNVVSLCLFSSPPLTGYVHASYGGHEFGQSKKLGWMHTGDAPWGTQYQIKAAKAFYSNFLGDVGVLVVPHHGSGHNFRVEAFKMCSPDFVLLPYGIHNKHGHPHGRVTHMLHRVGVVRRDVTENPSSGFSTQIDGVI